MYIYIAGFLLFSCTSHRSHRAIPIRFADLSSRAKAAIVRQRPWDRTPQTKPWGNPWEIPPKTTMKSHEVSMKILGFFQGITILSFGNDSITGNPWVWKSHKTQYPISSSSLVNQHQLPTLAPYAPQRASELRPDFARKFTQRIEDFTKRWWFYSFVFFQNQDLFSVLVIF